MNLSDVFSITFSILGFITVCIGYWLMAAGLFPGFVERSAEQFGRAPARLGALGFALVPLMIALFGAAGLALLVGIGLKSARDETEGWRRVLRGGIVVGLTFVLPFIGTFLVLPYTLLGGFGAFLICARRQRTAPAGALASPPELPASAVSVPTP